MIVNIGTTIKIRYGDFEFVRDSDRPGVVVVCSLNKTNTAYIELPANESDREGFILAYKRAAEEPIEYRKKSDE